VGLALGLAAGAQAQTVEPSEGCRSGRTRARHGAAQSPRARDGSNAADRVTRAGYRWRRLGENIALGQTTPERVVREWVLSPEHCATLMNPAFTEMGVAYNVNLDSADGIYWAQLFARPR
jgi:uncharacterized protein YkwD